MKNKYVDFVSDEHLLKCVENLFNAYERAQATIDKKRFYSNKIDIFKLTFDAHFSQIEPALLIQSEITRQIDKSINNSIGTFHEEVLGGIIGFQQGNKSGYDIKSLDDTLFADIKNKHNTMNSSAAESLFQKLKQLADNHKKAKCYWVQILAKDSFCDLWQGEINGKEYSHSRVYKISGDQFYALLTGQADALYSLYKALPNVITDYRQLSQNGPKVENSLENSITSIVTEAKSNNRSIIDQIARDNFDYYQGFDTL